MISKAFPRENARALFSAAIAGSTLGLGGAALYASAMRPVPPAAPAVRPAVTIQPPHGGVALARAPVAKAKDVDCLTQAVYYEARGDSDRGQAAVAQVVMNRVKNPIFPKSVCAVVYQRLTADDCQFSFVCDRDLMHRTREPEAWDHARDIAQRALAGHVMVDIGSATNFHAARLGQKWGDGFIRVTQVGAHIFYRLGRPHADEVEPASQGKPERVPAKAAEVKPVLASLLPLPSEAPKPEVKDAPAEARPAAKTESPAD